MPKQGKYHDYDSHANLEPSAANQKCDVCGDDPMSFQWSDFHGEGMCTRCGCPYQLRAGSEKMREEGSYPYRTMRDEFIEPVRAYYEETRKFTYLGQQFGGTPPGLVEFYDWFKTNRRELWDKLMAEQKAEPEEEG